MHTIEQIEEARHRLGDHIVQTPIWLWESPFKRAQLGDMQVIVKLELLQYAGSFKPRGALMVMMSLDKKQLDRGVTAISAGNHAVAVCYAARVLNTNAKVVMPKAASRMSVDACAQLGGQVVIADDTTQAFEVVKEIESTENRHFVHPFEGPLTSLGTATLGLEFYKQARSLDAVIIPIGGGGLAAGMSMAIKQLNPDCEIFGVEPEGANSMYLSMQSGEPQTIVPKTIAGSLAPPFTLPYAFEMCSRHLEEVVLIGDEMMKKSMAIMYQDLKLAVEPAAAASMAALLGPLKERLRNSKRVGIIACGSNIDMKTFFEYAYSH